jgi:amidase
VTKETGSRGAGNCRYRIALPKIVTTVRINVVETVLDRIAASDDLNAYVTVLNGSARERARGADRATAAGENLGPLHGVPVAIKDLRDRTAGVRNTLGLAALADNAASEDSITVERLEAAGAVVVGTTNTPALGHTIRRTRCRCHARTRPPLVGPVSRLSGGVRRSILRLCCLAPEMVSDLGQHGRVGHDCEAVAGLDGRPWQRDAHRLVFAPVGVDPGIPGQLHLDDALADDG